ncbi:hypothetical protein cypCar_00026539, partial [Cyprinus carpio]
NRSSADQKFIIDTLYGCNMHKKLLDVVFNIFYNHHGKKLFSVDRNLFIGKLILLILLMSSFISPCSVVMILAWSISVELLDISNMHKVPATTHRTPKEPEILDEMKQSNQQKL